MEENNTNLFVLRDSTKKFGIISLHCLEDKALSWKAKAIYTYLFTRPSNWTVNMRDLIGRSSDGENSLRSGIKELIDNHYIARICKRNENGQMARFGFLVFNVPIETVKEAEVILTESSTEPGWCLPLVENHPPLINNNINKEQGSSSLSSLTSLKTQVSPEPYGLAGAAAAPPAVPIRGGDRVRLDRSRKDYVSNRLSQPKPKPSIAPVNIPAVHQEIMDLHGLVHHYRDKTTGVYKNSVLAIKKLERGLAFNNLPQYAKYHNRCFTCDEIKSVVYRMMQACSPDYLPRNKDYLKSLVFSEVVYSPISKRSMFLEYFETAPKPYGDGIALRDDPHPTITLRLESWYKTKKGLRSTDLTIIEKNQLRQCTKLFIEFHKRNHQRMTPLREQDMADLICEAIYKKVGEQSARLNTALFSADWVWRDVIPSYFIDQCAMQE